MARRGFWARLSLRSGQANMEYALAAIVIGLIVLFVVNGFGGGVAKRFRCMTLQVGLVRIDPSSSTSVTQAEGCAGEAIAAVPPEPLPSDPLTAQVRHHLGDGICAGPSCGGGMVPEGLSMTVPIKLTQEQLDYAKDHGNQIILMFDGTGVDMPKDSVSFGGASITNVQNGANKVAIATADLVPGDYALIFGTQQILDNPAVVNFDDYEVNNIQVVFSS